MPKTTKVKKKVSKVKAKVTKVKAKVIKAKAKNPERLKSFAPKNPPDAITKKPRPPATIQTGANAELDPGRMRQDHHPPQGMPPDRQVRSLTPFRFRNVAENPQLSK